METRRSGDGQYVLRTTKFSRAARPTGPLHTASTPPRLERLNMPFDRTQLDYRVNSYYRDTVPGGSTVFYSGFMTQYDAYCLADKLRATGVFDEPHVQRHIQGEGWERDVKPHEPTDEGMEEMSAGIKGTPEMRECCSGACDWIGRLADAVHPKHLPDVLLCPQCNETTQCVGVQAQ